MKINEIDIEREIEKILSLGDKGTEKASVEQPTRKKAGRPATRHLIPVWALDFDDPMGNRSYAIISMCIKEDYSQSLSELATRLALCKNRPHDECLAILLRLRDDGHLGYYDDETQIFCNWKEGGGVLGLENMCS